ncbi:putative sigma-54 modulation protein [Paenibacillus sp. 1182]|uniref:ribosome hibernation-promoting factor, HPF/YfiA family n=1 Tax=Paenibacillus sp. 1182 TaxID=2806565 RepID=UPI001AE78EAA|nr:ribosome-associated translation inhibitor RaiA [Paenibacillus sp. 1182]MBP1308755.1 putative sigma-54 modulation protein [Paenibacillus sp. 1182]
MNVQLIAKNFELTKGIRDAINKRLEKLENFIEKTTPIRITMETFKYGQKIEVMFNLHGSFVKSEETNEDLYVAIDMATDKLVKKLGKLARKHNDQRHNSQPFNRELLNEDCHCETEERRQITKRKKFTMKPMMEEEAVLQMKMLGHETFMFFNGATQRMCLLYQRKDGNYGIIESVY